MSESKQLQLAKQASAAHIGQKTSLLKQRRLTDSKLLKKKGSRKTLHGQKSSYFGEGSNKASLMARQRTSTHSTFSKESQLVRKAKKEAQSSSNFKMFSRKRGLMSSQTLQKEVTSARSKTKKTLRSSGLLSGEVPSKRRLDLKNRSKTKKSNKMKKPMEKKQIKKLQKSERGNLMSSYTSHESNSRHGMSRIQSLYLKNKNFSSYKNLRDFQNHNNQSSGHLLENKSLVKPQGKSPPLYKKLVQITKKSSLENSSIDIGLKYSPTVLSTLDFQLRNLSYKLQGTLERDNKLIKVLKGRQKSCNMAFLEPAINGHYDTRPLKGANSTLLNFNKNKRLVLNSQTISLHRKSGQINY